MKKLPSQRALKLLHQASFLNNNNFMCFGNDYFTLFKLNLVDKEMKVTYLGKQFIQFCIDEGIYNEEKK